MEKRDVIHGGAQLTSLDPENVRRDFYDGKNVMSLTGDPNWPLWWKKRHVTDAGPQLTSMMEKTSRHWRGTPTDLLDF